MNEKYTQALSDFLQIAQNIEYFVVGSIALLSYTQQHGYDREIHDIDIIMETGGALKISEDLRQLGYIQTTFINPRMPFYTKLMKHAQNKYLRFSKEGVDIEILATNIENLGNLIAFEIYPGIKAGLPKEIFTKSVYSGIEFKTVTKEMLYYFKKVAQNTMGRKVKYKEEQRLLDIQHLEKLIDKNKFDQLVYKCKLNVCGLRFRLPKFLLLN